MDDSTPLRADAIELHDVDILEDGVAPSFDLFEPLCAKAPPGPTEPPDPAPPDTA